MSERQTVLVDMDGVLADFDSGVTRFITERYPEISIRKNREHFYIAEDYPEQYELVKSISREQHFFNSLPLVDDALYGWQRIIDSGRWPRICSSPIQTNPHCEKEKLEWLEHNFAPVFGMYVVDQAIITPNKESYEGVALIDDRPQLRNSDNATWQHIIFDRPYNRGYGNFRLHGWLDPELKSVLDQVDPN